MNCICNYLRKVGEIQGFRNPKEYQELQTKLEQFVDEGKLEEPEIIRKYFWNRRYKCIECGTIWVLTEHDFPFRGYFGKVEWLNEADGI